MRCGFLPHDNDPTTKSMEGFGWDIGPLWKGCWAEKREGFYGYPVNRWSIKRPPNGTKLDRRSTGGVPRPLGKSRTIPRMFNTRSQQETKGERRRA